MGRMAPTQPPRALAVHVLEEDALRVSLRADDFDVVRDRVVAHARDVVESSLGAEAEVSVVRGIGAEKTLAAAATFHGARGLVIGRQAHRGEDRLILLGRVARRLLRALPVPVIVVPPDLTSADLGEGPVLLATDLHDDASEAVRFARALARDLSRSLEVVHVVPLPDLFAATYLPVPNLEAARRELLATAEPDVRAWLDRHDLAGAKVHLVGGDVVPQLAATARAAGSPLVVCGSRQLGVVERWFSTSVASGLAAAGTTPVAVVPCGR
jgi:nucleotide-binding universal stress UspA family protein